MLTRLLVAINVIAYLWERFDGRPGDAYWLVDHGGLYGAAVQHGEWWRILTSAFLHGSDMHILFNMFALWQVGTFVEIIYGSGRTAAIYFLAAIGGGLAVTYFTPDVVTVGASGAIFGLFGALGVAGSRMGAPGRSLMQQTVGIIAINLAIALWPGSNISIVDHLGGLVAGTLFGFALYRPRQLVAAARPEAQRIGPDPTAMTIEHQPDEPFEHDPRP